MSIKFDLCQERIVIRIGCVLSCERPLVPTAITRLCDDMPKHERLGVNDLCPSPNSVRGIIHPRFIMRAGCVFCIFICVNN
jgi:hypothetical protein